MCLSVYVLLPSFFYFLDSTYISENIQYLFFSVWLTSLVIITSRSIHIVASGKSSFFFMTNIPMEYYMLYICNILYICYMYNILYICYMYNILYICYIYSVYVTYILYICYIYIVYMLYIYIISHLLYPVICWWTHRLFLYLGYYKQCCYEHGGGAYIFLS